ncbi:hypothetical protein COF68_05765 [Bacillus toyonensis]|uniref:hypothetical protein n=1 Tax=Bacillus toyonensis TaxID=155322 RepID=UPI000BFE7365|nr:hypothetical protein [Bacillus toyonensis]PHE64347.1 hypothetical protein COF68_05765 [Bacillus toyonensis]
MSSKLKAYRVLLNEATTDVGEPRGLYKETIQANSEQELKAEIEKNYVGEFVNAKETEVTDNKMLVQDMVFHEEYTIIADTEHSNSTLTLCYDGEKITSVISGGEFKEDWIHEYNLEDILEIFHNEDLIEKIPVEDMTLHYLEYVDSLVYSEITTFKEVPEKYKGLAKRHK